jgi:predicted permease
MGLKALLLASPPDLPRIWEGIQLDGMTLAFTMIVTLATGLICGLAPAWQSANPALSRELCESGRGSSAGPARQRFRATLVAGEVAVSLMLLIGAGLMIQSFARLVSQNLGYNPEHVVSLGIGLPGKKYPGQAAGQRFFDRLLEGVRATPGVESAALAAGLPLSGWNSSLYVRVLGAPPPAPGEAVSAGYSQISPGYFHTMNIPVLRGRDFTDQDQTNSPAVAIVDETFVKHFKLGDKALGTLILVGDGTDSAEIVGVVKDVKRNDIAEAPNGELYRSYRQKEWGYMSVVLRTRNPPTASAKSVRAVLDTIDKDQPIENVRSMTQLVASSVAQKKLSARLLGGFAGVATLLAAIGLYGALAGGVAQRTKEIGIRMALGARQADVLGLVMRQGMRLTGFGIAVGLMGAFGLTRVMASLLYDIKPFDPATFAGVSLLMAAVAACACWLPARRAARVDPIVSLRHE